MKLNSTQIEVFRRDLYIRFEERLLAHLRKHHPVFLKGVTNEVVRSYINTCVERSQQLYELTSEQSIACYSQLPLILGNDFEINPDFYSIVVLLGKRSFEQNTRAKMALAIAYHLNPEAK